MAQGAYLLEQFAGVPPAWITPVNSVTPTAAGTEHAHHRRDPVGNRRYAGGPGHGRRTAPGPWGSGHAPRQLGITNRPESSLARQVTHLLDIGAGIEVGVAATKTFLGQLLAFYALALAFAARRGPAATLRSPP